MKEKLFGKNLFQLEAVTNELGLPKYTAKQIADWLYKKRVVTFDKMTNLSKKVRMTLEDHYETGLKEPVSVQISKDGTKKYLFKIGQNGFVEAAYIPENKRATLCLSSQVGCKMNCGFCATGKQGFQGNLTAGEILNQIVSIPETQKVTNIVYMGMGEPLDNLDEVLKSLEILVSEWGFGWSSKKITVSTIGVIPAMKRLLDESNVHLAVSLHTPFDDERSKLMPVNNAYHVKDIINLLKKYKFDRNRRLSFEYIVFGGINDTKRHVKELARLLNGLKCRINLIRFHNIPESDLKPTDENRLLEFKESLNAKGILTTIRASRGQDIDAACGLLSTKELLKNKND
jgi:23S rRNA (adenine2503-C2)-methyltransferase